jgi:type I restriction enzyme S subunit
MKRMSHGWREGTLGDICVTQYGYTASSVDGPVGPKFLRVKDINKQNWIEWDCVPHCEISEQERTKYSLAVGDVVVARMADPGKAAIIETAVNAVFASYLVRLSTESLAHSYYVYGFLKSDEYADYAASSRSGSVQANMNAKVIVGARILIPPMELLQAHLAQILPLRSRLAVSLNESATLAQLRDMLLPKLMSGEIRVRDVEKVVEDVT